MHPDILADQLGFSAVAVALIQMLKNAKWLPWVNEHSTAVNRVLSTLAASAAVAGIHFSWGMEAGVLTVSGLTGGNLGHFAWEATKQIAYQEGIFRAAVKPIVKMPDLMH